eukprot:gene9285-10265_t
MTLSRKDGLEKICRNAEKWSDEQVARGFCSQQNNSNNDCGIMEEMQKCKTEASHGNGIIKTDKLFEEWSEYQFDFSSDSESGYEAGSESDSDDKFEYKLLDEELEENNGKERMNEEKAVHENEANQSVGIEIEAADQPTKAADQLDDYSSDDIDNDDDCDDNHNNNADRDVNDSESDDIDVPEATAPLDMRKTSCNAQSVNESNTNLDSSEYSSDDSRSNILRIIRDIRNRTNNNAAPSRDVTREAEASQIVLDARFDQVNSYLKDVATQTEEKYMNISTQTESNEAINPQCIAAESCMEIENNTQSCCNLMFNSLEPQLTSKSIAEEESMEISLNEEMLVPFYSQMHTCNWLDVMRFRLPTPVPMDIDEPIEAFSNAFGVDNSCKQWSFAPESKLFVPILLPEKYSVENVEEGRPGQWFFEAGNKSQDATASNTLSDPAQLKNGEYSSSFKNGGYSSSFKNEGHSSSFKKRKHTEEADNTSQESREMGSGKVLEMEENIKKIATTPSGVVKLKNGGCSWSLKRSIIKRKSNERNNKAKISGKVQEESPEKIHKTLEMSKQVAADGVSANKELGGCSWSLKRNGSKRDLDEQDNNNYSCLQESRKKRKLM